MEQPKADVEGAGGAGIKLKKLMDDGSVVYISIKQSLLF